MRKFLIVVLIIILFFVVLGFSKDQLIKSVISAYLNKVTGAPVEIKSFSLGIISRSMRLSNLKMLNPKGFNKGILLDIPRINLDYNLFSFLMGKLYLEQLTLELKEVGIIKNKQGKLNVDSLKFVDKERKQEKSKKKKDIPLQLDIFNLRIGRLVFKDFSVNEEPSIQVYDINLNKSYKNISSVQQLVALIMSESMKAAGIKSAAIYGISALAGVAVLPVAIAGSMVGRDSVEKKFSADFQATYSISLAILKDIGQVYLEDRDDGIIRAKVQGSKITVNIKSLNPKSTQVTVSARKFNFPKPQIAGGILYRISEMLK